MSDANKPSPEDLALILNPAFRGAVMLDKAEKLTAAIEDHFRAKSDEGKLGQIEQHVLTATHYHALDESPVWMCNPCMLGYLCSRVRALSEPSA